MVYKIVSQDLSTLEEGSGRGREGLGREIRGGERERYLIRFGIQNCITRPVNTRGREGQRKEWIGVEDVPDNSFIQLLTPENKTGFCPIPECRRPPPKKRKKGSQKCWENTHEVHLEVTRLKRHAVFRKSVPLDDVDCFEALKSHTYH